MIKNYFKFISAAHLFLIKDDKILLARRFNTGYEDGNYSVPAGHLEENERATEAMLREAKEETGIELNEIQMVHVMHRKAEEERIDFFFEAKNWKGEPKIMEKDKCDKMIWSSLDELPENVIPYVKSAIENYRNNIYFSEFGWD